MATKWGSEVVNGSYNRWQGGVEAYVESSTATTSTVVVRARFYTKYAIQSSQFYGYTACGGSSGESQFTVNSKNGQDNYQTGREQRFTVNRPTGNSNAAVTCTGRVRNTGSYTPGSSQASVSVTIAHISHSAPAAPSSCAAVRVSDSQADVTWSNGASTTTAPRSSVLVERQTDGGDWVQIASLAASATNYSDNSTSPNHQYAYRVRAYGYGGYSGYSTSEYVYTTPAAPATVSLSKVTDTTVSVDITGAAPYATSFDVQYRLNGGDWQSAGSTSTWPFQHDPGGGTAQYRVRAAVADLASGWTESGTITTITPPLAPSVVIAGGAGVVATGTEITISWTPNHPDGSDQSQAQVEVTIGSGDAVVHDVSGAATTFTVDAQAAATTVKARVRTHGLDPDWGAWSSVQTVSVAVPPSVIIESPAVDGYVVDMLPLHIEWEAQDATGVASQSLALSTGGRTVLSVPLDGSVSSYDVDAATYLLENGAEYALTIRVTGGSTLAVQAVRAFTVDYAGPAAPDVDVSYGEGRSCAVTVAFTEDPDHEQTSSVDIVRVLPDGSQWAVATGLGDGQQGIDPLPPLNLDFAYRVTAYSETGTVTTVEVAAKVEAMATAFNFGAGASVFEELALEPSRSRSVKISTELYDFADGGEGGGLPVAYSSSTLSVTGEEAATTLDPEQYRRLERLAREHPCCWVRDVHGGRSYCAASWSFSADVPHNSIDCSASLTETRWREAW